MAASYHGIYQKYTDQKARLADSVAVDTGTANTAYPATLVVDDNPAHVCKIDSTSGSLLLTYAAKQPAEIFALIHTSLDEAADVVLQGNDTNSWGSPSFEVPIVVPAWRGAGVTRWPVNPWVDLTLAAGYDAAGWKYWRLAVAGNSQNIQIGQLWLGGTIRRYDPNVDWGATHEFERLNIVNRTAYNVKHTTRRGTVQWRRTASIEDCPDDLRDDLQDHVDDVDGDTFPWLLIPDGLVNDARLVRYADSKKAITYRLTNSNRVDLTVEELSRGLRPGT